MKAMILAAGRGERLRPLTDHTPKPLIPINDKCLLDYHLERLAAVGVHEVVINVAHLAEKIQHHVGDGSRYGLSVQFSVETTGMLGTGGGVFNALPLLGPEPFILLSADVYSDYPLQHFLRPLTGWLHLVMVPTADDYSGDFALTESGQLTEHGQPLLTFGGLALVHPHLFVECEPGEFSINPLMRRAIRAGQATGELYQGNVINVTSLSQLQTLGYISQSTA